MTVLNESGTLSLVRGDLDQARSCHQQALDIARQIGSVPGEADALAGLARCARELGHTAEAEDLHRRALVIYQRIGATPAAAGVSAELEAMLGPPSPGNQASHLPSST